MPSFNLQGITEVKTSAGAFVSLIITTLTIAFSVLKLEHLLRRRNAQVITHETPLELDERYEVANSEFMIAFALESWEVGVKYDQRYI